MNKKIIGIMIGITLIVSGLIVAEVSAVRTKDSYVIYGIVEKGAGVPENGIEVTVTNTNTTEHDQLVTYIDDLGQNGTFQFNLGNLATGWQRGDVITVFAEDDRWQGTYTFTIPDTGTMHDIGNLIMKKVSGGGGGEGGGNILTGAGGVAGIVLIGAMIAIIGFLWWIFAAGKRRRRN